MWGKLLGTCFGFMFGRWLGAALGFWLGHLFDKSLKQDFDKAGGFQGFFDKGELDQRQALFFSLFCSDGAYCQIEWPRQ